MCSDHANVSANQRGVGWEGVGGAGLLPVAGVAGGGGGELNKDVSRPDRGGETGREVGETRVESNQGGLISRADEDGDVLLAP